MTENSNQRLTETVGNLKNIAGFDQGSLETLVSETNPEVVLSVLKEFRTSLINGSTDLEKAVDASDAEVTKKVCHKLAGTAELLGFATLGATCRQIENHLKQGLPYGDKVPAIRGVLEDARDIAERLGS